MNEPANRIHDAITGNDWVRRLFGPAEDADGARVGGMTLRRDPVTGLLCGVVDAAKKKETA